MTSKVEIVNIALARLGNSRGISSLTEASREASQASLLYNLARDRVLADHPWSFAAKTQALALSSESHPEWDYVYAYPSDCLRARYLATEGLTNLHGSWQELEYEWENRTPVHPTRARIRFDVGLAQSGASRVILTNEQNAILAYTARVDDPNAYPALFTDALAWRLAYEFTMTSAASSELRSQILQELNLVMGTAKAESLDEGQEAREPDSEFIRARR